ncbi:stress-response A/B barrel domain-containing protein UP3-like [Magnolia sinica]|uniref:stress-response A/B barrel domain-containing protein UP3-like n=1 Tax=Magnolia sinica TaxID=86752 RepID=UPI00265B2364|nr:stress-response A/B barrel domain-containing protein UP3-like [Magnolia sinica]
MSSQTVEHLVLFRVKPNTHPSKIDDMISGLNSLSSLPSVVYMTAVPISRSQSHPFNFTHVVHGRFKTKSDLDSYAAHRAHRKVAKLSFLPICDEYLIADWVSEIDGPAVPRPGSTLRITLLKPKEGLGDGSKKQILNVVGGIRNSFPEIDQVSFGENFSTIGHNGFTVGSISIFSGPKEIDVLDSTVEMQKVKARALVESVVVVDYEIPPLAPSKL